MIKSLHLLQLIPYPHPHFPQSLIKKESCINIQNNRLILYLELAYYFGFFIHTFHHTFSVKNSLCEILPSKEIRLKTFPLPPILPILPVATQKFFNILEK